MLLNRSLGAAFPHPRDGVKVELHTGRTTLTPAWECGTSREPPEVSQPAAIIPHVANRYTAGNPKFALATSRGYVRLVRVGRQPSSKVAWPRIVRRNGVWMATDDPEEPDPDVLDDIAEQMRLEQELATWIDEPAGPDENTPTRSSTPKRGHKGLSARSRMNMRRLFVSLPWELVGSRPALISLTYPGTSGPPPDPSPGTRRRLRIRVRTLAAAGVVGGRRHRPG